MPKLAENPPIRPLPLLAKRWLLSATLVFATYNPSGHSYYHWIRDTAGSTALKSLAGIFLLCAAAAILRMASEALSFLGIATVLALILAGIMLRIGLGWFAFADVEVTTYTVLLWISTIIGMGLSWSFLQRRLSGEKDVVKSL